MPTTRLTAAAVERIRPPIAGQADYFDKGFPGLALRVSYGGAKAWAYMFRAHGKLRRVTLGRWPAMSLSEARDAWREARKAVDRGENPARPKPADAFEAVMAEWLKRDQAGNRAVAAVERILRKDALPAFEGRPIATIRRPDIHNLLDRVVDRGSPIMARSVHGHMHRLFRWAVGRGVIVANPMENMPKPVPAVARDRVLSDAELAAVWRASDRISSPFGPIVKLLVLSGARRNEIAALRWSEIKNDRIELPAGRVKNGETKTIPLSPAAVAILEAVPRIVDSAFVFTVKGSKPASIGWRAKERLDGAADEIMGEPLPDWRVHDIRRSVATGLQRLGTRLEVIEAVLGHTSGSRAGIVGVYQRYSFTDEKRAALEAWARHVEGLVSGATETVVAFRGDSMTERTIMSPKGLLTNEILACDDPRINFMELDPQELIKSYIGSRRKWACQIIKDEGGDPARYHEILSGRKNPKPSVPATGRCKSKQDGAAKGRGTSDSSELKIPVELDSKYAAAQLLCHLDDVEKCVRSLQIIGEQNSAVWEAIRRALFTGIYEHQLTIVENEEAIDFGVNKRPQGAKKGGKARAEQLKEDNRERDIGMSVAYDSAKIKSECVSKLAGENKLSKRATYKAISRGKKLRIEPGQSSNKNGVGADLLPSA